MMYKFQLKRKDDTRYARGIDIWNVKGIDAKKKCPSSEIVVNSKSNAVEILAQHLEFRI